jgi:hypothetical protein
MVLLAAASLIGIAGIRQYIEGQTPPAATPERPVYKDLEGQVMFVVMFERNKACSALVKLTEENSLNLPVGTIIRLGAPSESFCTLFGLSKIGKTTFTFDALKAGVGSEQRLYSVTRVTV